MRTFLNEFCSENLFGILVFAFFLCYFALKYKSVKRIVSLILTTFAGFVSVALFYKLGFINVDIYIYTCNIVIKICTLLENVTVSGGEALYRLVYRIVPTFTFLVFYNTLFLQSTSQILSQNIVGLVFVLDYHIDFEKKYNTIIKNIVTYFKKEQSLPMVLRC